MEAEQLNIDLKRIKRYDTRDLLQEDKMPPASREILFAVAPGKLKEMIESSDLVASDKVIEVHPEDARETDLFTSYIRKLGDATGPKTNLDNRRSQYVMQAQVVQ